ncbi:hypothetical protein [Amycolatopsis anabasis]|nr:hypothetical protein [Amycolatopsis anabasis]
MPLAQDIPAWGSTGLAIASILTLVAALVVLLRNWRNTRGK